MKKPNQNLSHREQAQKQWEAIQAMPKGWLTDIQVHELYIKELRVRHQKATVFWPGLGDRLLPDQIEHLKYTLQSDVNTVFIPINPGGHWRFVVLEREPHSLNQWVVKSVETPHDNFCGYHTVSQSMQILDEGLKKYSAKHPNKVHELDQNDPIRDQIRQALNANNVTTSSTTTTDQKNDDVQIAINRSLKTQYLSRFDFKLVQLAEYEALGYSIESLCQELAQMLADMTPQARKSAIDRLALSNLTQKPSIAKVIAMVAKPQISIAANRSLLMAAPTPKPGKQLRPEEELAANPHVSQTPNFGAAE